MIADIGAIASAPNYKCSVGGVRLPEVFGPLAKLSRRSPPPAKAAALENASSKREAKSYNGAARPHAIYTK